ncbi:MAG: hypothetical protein AVDCRST_MAG39-2433 [uncultured Sphingomonadaceae bacterium]|uniref:chorismate mutase n=1 Tax=uncultured Sphingomonadaceae bacterium TaxID=169976 RepID=A0A6J4T7A2_9SPHN|nr:MAG: hypothetical protein AVDCRST_MAG39-2433 [uncultured Sphingomonadaceae bacterium]
MPFDPEDCRSMEQVREGIDAADEALVALIALRFDYMDAAARLKTERATVRDEARKAAVLAHVQAEAEARGVDPALVARLWDELIEASIAYELKEWDELHPDE